MEYIQATAKDIVLDNTVYIEGDDGIFHKMKIVEVLRPSDYWKAFEGDDGCSYGLDGCFIKKEKSIIKMIPVFEYMDMPEEMREQLKTYYEGTDHRAINNDSYTRYPWLSDLEDSELDRWVLSQVPDGTYCVIIHWDW